MASDLSLLIFDPDRGTAVRARWLGMGRTRDRATEILGKAPARLRPGYECWSGVSPDEVVRITEARYERGATPEEIREYAATFPSPPYWWILEHDF